MPLGAQAEIAIDFREGQPALETRARTSDAATISGLVMRKTNVIVAR